MCLVFDESPQIPKKFRHRTTSYSSTSVLPPQHPITYPPRLTTSTLSLQLNTTSQLRRTHPCISETEPLHISNNTLSSYLVKTTSHNTRSLRSVTRPTHHRLGAASLPPPSTPVVCVLLPLKNLLWAKLRDYVISRVKPIPRQAFVLQVLKLI
jgi:hypothetical protein